MSEEVLRKGDVVRLSKVFIQNAPFWLPDITDTRVVDVVARKDGTKELHLQHIGSNDDDTTKMPKVR